MKHRIEDLIRKWEKNDRTSESIIDEFHQLKSKVDIQVCVVMEILQRKIASNVKFSLKMQLVKKNQLVLSSCAINFRTISNCFLKSGKPLKLRQGLLARDALKPKECELQI